MVTLLVIGSLVVAAGGLATLSQATMGPGLIALACLLGILARIAQASSHHILDAALAKVRAKT